MCQPWEALVIGGLGAALTACVDKLLWHLKVDDPVGVVPVHGACGLWGLVAVGLYSADRRKHTLPKEHTTSDFFWDYHKILPEVKNECTRDWLC